jgi:hypothetical protein
MKTATTVFFVGVHFGFSALLGGAGWHTLAFSYALLWPEIFVFAVLPGVLIGFCMRAWQSSVVLAEIITIVGATMIDHPTIEQLFQPLFAMHLAMAQLALFPPLLLSVLIGHRIRSWRSQGIA